MSIIGVMNNIIDNNGNKASHLKIIRNGSIGANLWSGGSSNTSNDWSKSILNTDVLNGSNVVWNLGGHENYQATATAFYNYERGTNVLSGNATIWTGKIALMYASDAVGGDERTECLGYDLKHYNSCVTNDWLFMSGSHWTLTHSIHLTNRVGAFAIFGGSTARGYVTKEAVTKTGYNVYPSLYLNSNVEITGGEGSQENPYTLAS